MTETNINALCSVEAVFDGIDIEVTVEFSAGGGTFEHDELTAESRAKANQHPIPSITGLQSALDGKANSSHVHNISDVTGLQSALDGKSSVVEHNDLTGRDVLDVHPKESITGLTILDSPEFADTQITPLSVEATYTPTVWSYLVGLFTTVPKSALQHLIKLWGVVNDLDNRVGLLEDKIIAEITITENVAQVTITVDKNGNPINIINGDSFIVEMEVEYVDAVDNLGRSGWMINNNSGGIYRRALLVADYMSSVASNQLYIKSKWMMSLFNRDLNGINMTINSADKVSYAASTANAWTIGLATENISRFDFIVRQTDSFKAGSKFIIKKV